MKPTKKCLKELVSRLCTLPSQDPVMFGSPEAISIMRNELGRALEASRSDGHATRAVDRLMSEAKWRPTPAEIREALEGTPEFDAPAEPDPNCQICTGSGWRIAHRCARDCPRCGGRGRVELGGGEPTAICPGAITGAERCSCLRRAHGASLVPVSREESE
jgi:hypothetical protein